jgi:hypothetical protein
LHSRTGGKRPARARCNEQPCLVFAAGVRGVLAEAAAFVGFTDRRLRRCIRLSEILILAEQRPFDSLPSGIL